jgi:hypothetical protein
VFNRNQMIHECSNNTGWRRFESPENFVDGELAAGEAGGSCQTRLLITSLDWGVAECYLPGTMQVINYQASDDSTLGPRRHGVAD